VGVSPLIGGTFTQKKRTEEKENTPRGN